MQNGDSVETPDNPASEDSAEAKLDRSRIGIPMGTIACKITKLTGSRPAQDGKALGIMSVCWSGPTGGYPAAARFIRDHGGNIQRSEGTTLDEENRITTSSFVFEATDSDINHMIQEIEMNRVDEIPINPAIPQLTKIFETRMTIADRPSLFYDIAEIMEPDAWIVAKKIITTRPFRLEGNGEMIKIARIYIKFEIPIAKLDRLAGIMDRIRTLAQEEYWGIEDPKEITPRASLERHARPA